MRIAVTGCGVAGMAAALSLAREGHDVTIFEAFETPAPMGSGLLLQPSGLKALEILGLSEQALDHGAVIERLSGEDTAGRKVMNMAYASWRPGAFGLGIHRATLFEILFRRLDPAGVALKAGVSIEDIVDPSRPVLMDSAGGVYGPFDMAVIADGSSSRLRARLRPRARAPLYPWGAVWANAIDEDGQFSGALHQRYRAAREMLGILPIGRGPDGLENQVSVFWSLPRDQLDSFPERDFHMWRRAAAECFPEAAAIINSFRGPEDFAKATYRDVQTGRWSRGATLLLGDAAHGTSPQLGQGANLALVDAVELGAALRARLGTAKALARYQVSRRLHTAPYQIASRGLTPLFQSAGWFGPFVRNYIFAPFSQASVFRKLAAIVLTGMFRIGPYPKNLRP